MLCKLTLGSVVTVVGLGSLSHCSPTIPYIIECDSTLYVGMTRK